MEQKNMNMISTGAFLTGMAASDKQETLVSKLVSAWEKKNAKVARAGGVSLMALSLAACGSDDTTTTAVATPVVETTVETTTVTVTPTVVGGTMALTPLTDVASANTAVNGSLVNDFRFTTADDTITAITASIQAADTLLDGSSTDNDSITITSTAAMNAMTAVSIETVNVVMAAGAPTAVLTNFTGTTAVNISGTTAGTLTNAGTATISTDSYGRVLTVQADLSGTTVLSTANTINTAVSGSTFGSTVATQSTILIDNTDAGTDTLETLNIASNGSAANVVYLNTSTDTNFSTINVTGGTAATVRFDHADVTGLTVVAGTNTADVDILIDRNGATTTATNILNMSGAETISFRDSTAAGDEGDVTGVAAGQNLVYVSDFTAADIDLAGVSRTAPAASVTVTLDNATAATDLDIAGNMDIQDVTAINIVSNGNPTTATAATAENAFTLVGDATSITLTGDTHIDTTLNIDASGALANAARAVTVDASGMTGTAYVELEAGASTLVSYTMTGTANADTLAANAAGSSMTAGAGADTITGGAGADTIIGGDGIDTVTPGAGADSLTLGAGADIVIMGAIDVTAVAQVSTHAASLTLAANDSVIVTVGTVAKTYALSAQDVTGNATLDAVELEANLANFINSSFTGVTAAITGGDLVITADTTVDATPTVTLVETTAGNGVIADTATTAGVDAVAVATTVTDFDTSAAGDVIHIDVSVVEGHAGVTKLSDGDGNVAAGDTVVILDYTVGTAFSDTDGVADGQNVIKAAYSSTLNSAANFDAAYNANTITLDNALADNDAITAVFYDADSSQAVLGFILQANSDGAVIDDDATFNEIGRFTMTQADYTLLNADDFAFI
jgi:hypothetical protein